MMAVKRQKMCNFASKTINYENEIKIIISNNTIAGYYKHRIFV